MCMSLRNTAPRPTSLDNAWLASRIEEVSSEAEVVEWVSPSTVERVAWSDVGPPRFAPKSTAG
jgi:hypothetical protein